MKLNRQIVVMTVSLLASVAAMAQAPDLATIVHRVHQAQIDVHGNTRPYQVTREYLFYQGEEKPQADTNVIADVTYTPPDEKQFAIRSSQGGGRGQRVVKKVLEHETEIAGQWQKTAVTDENYQFSLLGEETLNGRRCFILGLEPRREAKELLRGKAWVDAETFRIHQIQGEPAKSPSFWIKKLNVTLTFSEVEGMWLQTAVKAVADVRIFGRNMLAERDLDYRVSNEVAAKRPPHKRVRAETNIATFIR